jgi:hypothetical protein
VDEPQAAPERKRRTGIVARTVGTVGAQVDRAADRVERVADGVVQRAATAVEPRRGGSYAIALLHFARDGLLFMLRDWRLMLLQLPAAAAVSFVIYRLRVRAFGIEEIVSMSVGSFLLMATLAAVAFLVVFTCGTVFAFAMSSAVDSQRADLGAAWHATAIRWRRLVAWSIGAALLVSGLFFLARSLPRGGYTAVGIIGLGVVIGLIPLVPFRVSSIAARRGSSTRDRARLSAVGSSASVILEAPTIIVAEIGRLFAQVPGLRIFGWAAVVIGGLLHMAAASSVRALKLTAKLVTGEGEPASGDEAVEPSQAEQAAQEEQETAPSG